MALVDQINLLAARIRNEFNAVRADIVLIPKGEKGDTGIQGPPYGGVQNTIQLSVPTPGSNTTGAMGHTLTGTGTATSAADPVETGAVQLRYPRVEYLATTASTTAVAGIRTGRIVSRTDGFRLLIKAGVATGANIASHRFWCGLVNGTAAPTDVNPSTITQQIGVGYDSTDANVQIMHCAATAPATKVDTGIPVPTAARTDLYRVEIYAPDGGTTVDVTVTNLATHVKFTHTISTNLPTVPLATKGYASAGGTSTQVGYTHGGFQIWSVEA